MSSARLLRPRALQALTTTTTTTTAGRNIGSMAATNAGIQKAMGDISSVFPSLSGVKIPPLPTRFAAIKSQLIGHNKTALEHSWRRLLPALSSRIDEIHHTGPSIIPSIPFTALSQPLSPSTLAAIKKAGAVHIRQVLPPSLALSLKSATQSYIDANSPRVRAFPKDSPAVYELYWSPPQVAARSHPNLLSTQRWLQNLWHSSSPSTKISTTHTLTYADRLRIRLPGDAGFALGPHVDGGSLERWEDPTYSRVYSKVWRGAWEEYDPFDAAHRVDARMDLYNGAGACAMFRMFQGWLSLSSTGPGEGTLKLFPALKEATAYWLMRPFMNADGRVEEPAQARFEGAAMGACQELSEELHPHLRLAEGMVSIPRVEPGDYVAWHCDTIHSVDREHKGVSDASVFYIPTTPLTKSNAEYLKRQKEDGERSVFQR